MPTKSTSWPSLQGTAEAILDGIVERLLYKNPTDETGPTCFNPADESNIRVYMMGYASNGNVGVFNSFTFPSKYYAINFSEFNYIFTSFPETGAPSRGCFEPDITTGDLTGNDPFGAVLWVVDNWDDLNGDGAVDMDNDLQPNLRENAEKLIIVVTNDNPRNSDDSTGLFTHLSDTVIDIMHGYYSFRYIHDAPKFIEHNRSKLPYMVFLIAPPPDFPGGDGTDDFEGWPSMEHDSIYVNYGDRFEQNETNNYYYFPMLRWMPEDSEWSVNDDTSSDAEFGIFRKQVMTALNHFLITVHYEVDSFDNLVDESNMSRNMNITLPNPVSNLAGLLRDIESIKSLRLQVFDIFGAKRWDSGLGLRESKFNNGVYLLRIRDRDGMVYERKIVKIN